MTITATHWGVVDARIEEGRLKLAPWKGDLDPSPNLERIARTADAPSRTTVCAVRRGWLEGRRNGADVKGRLRGRDEWVPLSWDEALTLAADAIRETYATAGSDAVWGNSYGWMSPGIVHSAVNLNRRLLRLLGGFVEAENSYSTGAIAKILPEIVGMSDPRSTDWSVVLGHTDEIVLWGANPLVTNDIDWVTTIHAGRRALKDFAASGRRITSVNPIATESAAELHAETVALRPGTDAALVFGIIAVLIKDGKVDFEFLKTHVVGWERVVERIEAGFNEETAAAITGVPAETIRALARRWSSGRTMIMGGWGPQRSIEGENGPWSIWTLAAFLGQIGLPGCGIGTNYHYSDGGVPPSAAADLPGIPSRPAPLANLPWAHRPRRTTTTVPVASVTDVLLAPNAPSQFHGRTVETQPMELVMWAGGNPFTHQPDLKRLAEAFRRMKTVIVADTHWTPAARMADIVFPAASLFERRDLTSIGSYSNLGVAVIEPVRAPQGDARPDYEIFAALAERIHPSVGAAFTEGLDAEGWLERLWAAARRENAARGIDAPTLDELRAMGVWLCPKPWDAKPFVAFEAFRRDPEAAPLRTPTGKIELVSGRLEKLRAEGLTNLPWGGDGRWMKGDECAPDELVLLATKSPKRLHSQLEAAEDDAADIVGGVPVPGVARPVPEPEPAELHPEDAAARGLREGDLCVVENDRGALLARVKLNPGNARGTVRLGHGGWVRWRTRKPQAGEGAHDALDAHDAHDHEALDLRGQANVLTSDEPTSDFARGNVASGWRVRVRKAAEGS